MKGNDMTKAQRLYRELRKHLARDDARYVATGLAGKSSADIQRMMYYYTDGKFNRP
jgi:glyoxylate carboligase